MTDDEARAAAATLLGKLRDLGRWADEQVPKPEVLLAAGRVALTLRDVHRAADVLAFRADPAAGRMTADEAQVAARALIATLAGIAAWADDFGKPDEHDVVAVGQLVLTVGDLRLARKVVAHVDARG